MSRLLCEIGAEIASLWPISKTHSAKPYLLILQRLKTMHDSNGMDTPKDIISMFLALASDFTGEDAVRLKAELKVLMDSIPRNRGTVKGLTMEAPALAPKS